MQQPISKDDGGVMRASGQDVRSITFFSPERPTKASTTVCGQSAETSTRSSATFSSMYALSGGNRIKLRLPFVHTVTTHHSIE